MANPSKQRGTAFETLEVDYFAKFIPGVHRNVMHGSLDIGDIDGLPDVFECKNVRGLSLPAAMKEAQREAENAKRGSYVVGHKRHGSTDPALQLVTMENWRYVEYALAMNELESNGFV